MKSHLSSIEEDFNFKVREILSKACFFSIVISWIFFFPYSSNASLLTLFGFGESNDIQNKIGRTILNAPSPRCFLTPVHKTDDVIKTQCQRPTLPHLQHATHLEISAQPNKEFYEHEKVLKIINANNDGRIKIDQTNVWPNSVHGVVAVRFKNTPINTYAWGTGTLISSNVVISAAHNFYHATDGQATEIRFLPAMNGKIMPFNEPKVIDYFYPKAYVESKGSNEDYGILILDTPLGDVTGYFGLSVLPATQIKNLTISVTGYPGDKVASKNKEYELWGMEGKAINVDPHYITYEIDTYPGQSGSGVWYQDEDHYYIAGVHVAADPVLPVNKATILTHERFAQIQSWIKESIRKRITNVIFSDIKSLDLSGSSLGSDGLNELVKFNLPQLTALNLFGASIVSSGSFTAVVNAFPNLIDLNLGNNLSISINDVMVVSQRLTNLTRLNIDSIGIGDKGLMYMARFLSKLVNLELRNCRQAYWLSYSSGGALAQEAAQRFPNLTSLSLNKNELDNQGILALIWGNPASLTSLFLGENNIRDEGVHTLTQHLTKLKTLHLNNNAIKNTGFTHIAHGLTNLTKLDISYNYASAYGGVIDIATQLTNLTNLNLSAKYHEINEGYEIPKLLNNSSIINISKHLTNLTWLGLRNVGVTHGEIFTLARGLTNLETLDINDYYTVIRIEEVEKPDV